MNKYFVIGTEREDICDSDSAIKKLVLDRKYGDGSVWKIADLKSLADQGLLYTEPDNCGNGAEVFIYYSSYFARWIATTKADGTQCNNLLSLPIYYPAQIKEGTTYFSKCELR
mgnify:CR=1 FL=1